MIQRRVSPRGVPAPASLRRWARAALEGRRAEITLRVVGDQESQLLNRQFRNKDKPTNVLSFPYSPHPTAPSAGGRPLSQRARGRFKGAAYGRKRVVGDIVLCAPVVAREARAQRKAPAAHWAHMVVHGVLHLRGYDHVRARDARMMEGRERRLLSALSFPDPYRG